MIGSVNQTTTAAGLAQTRANAFSDLSGEDFLKLLVTQLTTQDPLEPTGNKELLEQISSIRDIELSTTMSESLRTLAGEQRFSSTSGMIGQFVTSVPDDGGLTASGVVTGVRFDSDGTPQLQLSDGSALPLNQVAQVEPPLRAAERLLGQSVSGLDRRSLLPLPVEGVVSGFHVDDRGDVVLDLESGKAIRLRDAQVTPAE